MAQLRRLGERTGPDEARRRAVARGTAAPLAEGEVSLFGVTFRGAAAFGVESVPQAVDLEENLRSVRDASRFADLVLVSMHCHEVEGDRGTPPGFLVSFARACIDAGADVFIGHGPHALRGMEIHRGRPIFYSLGNFLYQAEFARQLPGDNYIGRDMRHWTASEFHDHFTAGETKGPPTAHTNWESVVPVCTFQEGRLARVEVRPITLGQGSPLPRRARRASPGASSESGSWPSSPSCPDRSGPAWTPATE